MSRAIEIAEKLVEKLNSTTFSLTVTAARTPRPHKTLGDMDGRVYATVVPKAFARSTYDRASELKEYEIWVGVQQRLDEVSNETTDPLVNLVEDEISGIYKDEPYVELADDKKFRWMTTDVDVFMDERHLGMSVFTSLMTFKFRLVE